MRWWNWIKEKLRYMKVLETGMSFIMLSWGIILALPGNSFALSPAHQKLGSSLSEGQTAALFLIIGLLQLIGMMGNFRRIRRAGHLLAAGIWFQLGTRVVMVMPLSPAWSLYYILSFMTAYLYWKVGEQ